MNDTTAQLLCAGVVPLVVALPLVRRERDPESTGARGVRGLAALLAFGLPTAIAFAWLEGMPKEQWQRVLFVAVASLVVGTWILWTRPRIWMRVVQSVVLGLVAVGVTWPIFRTEPPLVPALTVVGVVAFFCLIDTLARRRPGPLVPGGLALAGGAIAAAVLLSGFMKLTVPFVALVVAIAVAAVAAMRGGRRLDGGPLAPVAALFVVVPVVAWLYARSVDDVVTAGFLVPAAAAPIFLWTAHFPPLRKHTRLGPVLAWILVALVAGSAAATLRWGQEEPSGDDPYAEMYGDMLGFLGDVDRGPSRSRPAAEPLTSIRSWSLM